MIYFSMAVQMMMTLLIIFFHMHPRVTENRPLAVKLQGEDIHIICDCTQIVKLFTQVKIWLKNFTPTNNHIINVQMFRAVLACLPEMFTVSPTV